MSTEAYAQALRDTAQWPASSRQARIDYLYAEMREKGLIAPGVEVDKADAVADYRFVELAKARGLA